MKTYCITGRRSERGVALIVSLIVAISLLVLSAGLTVMAIGGQRASDAVVEGMHALYRAEAGIAVAVQELNSNTDLSGDGVIGNATEWFMDGTYTVTAVDNGDETYTLTATGTKTGVQVEPSERTVEVVVGPGTSTPFRWAAFGDESVGLNGAVSKTDSYNSDDGDYDPANPGSNGDVGSNGDIAIGGTVNGTANLYGPDANISGAANATGGVVVEPNPKQVPPVDPGNAAASNDNATITSGYNASTGKFNPVGNTVVALQPGTYYFKEWQLTGNAVVQVSGPTTIFVEGKFHITGCSNLTGKPENLKIFLLQKSTVWGDSHISGNADFQGVIYAPEAYVMFGGTPQVYGAVVAKALKIAGNADFHYDEALDDVSVPASSNYAVRSWRELNTPPAAESEE